MCQPLAVSAVALAIELLLARQAEGLTTVIVFVSGCTVPVNPDNRLE